MPAPCRFNQEGASTQSDLQTGTRRAAFAPGAHRLSQAGQQTYRYNANGQPQTVGQREYVWDALGRLLEVRQEARTLARYQYDHRGLRNAKRVGEQTTHTLYDESRQPLAELDGQGRITRQYIYLADMALAVIDRPHPLAPQTPGVAQVLSDLGQVLQGWLGASEGLVWLHTNHLGAPEAATDSAGQLVWQASYAPFGAASVQSAGRFRLNLRLPGQYFDGETALHYNRARYYDPQQGQYLSPDPLGTPDGPNGYAYVRFNPLKYVDPDGLVLFAFDGTGNDLSDAGSLSNVARFSDLYQGGGQARYVTGVGTQHLDNNWGHINVPLGDAGTNGSGTRRIERMMTYLMEEARAADDNTALDIDIVGFSRGAAQARDFANNIIRYSGTTVTGDVYSFQTDARGWFTYSATVRNAAGKNVQFQGRQCVNFRFLGLWDTVLSTNSGRDYRMGIPAQFAHVVQAVALNEHRAAETAWNATRRNLGVAHWGGFPLVSVGASSNSSGQVRIERGFIGAHADIGGGYPGGENQLSFVALSWMVAQARSAGVDMNLAGLDRIPTSNPIIHDQSNALRVGRPTDAQGTAQRFTVGGMLGGTSTYTVEDRAVQGAVSGNRQRNMGFTDFKSNNRSMTHADTMDYITYLPRTLEGQDNSAATWNSSGPQQVNGGTNQTGRVDIVGYMQWLRGSGYCFAGDACDRAPR